MYPQTPRRLTGKTVTLCRGPPAALVSPQEREEVGRPGLPASCKIEERPGQQDIKVLLTQPSLTCKMINFISQ